MTMNVQFTKVGDVYMLPISEEFIKQLRLNTDEKMSVSVEGNNIVARPLSRIELEKKVDDAMSRLLVERREVYEKLAEGVK